MSRKERFTPQEKEQACIDYIEWNRSRSEICRELYISTSTMNIPVRRVLPHENIQMVGLTTTELSISDFRCLLPENEYFLKSGNRIMTEDTDCVNMCLKIILPKNRKNSKSGNRGWHHAAYSKKKVFR